MGSAPSEPREWLIVFISDFNKVNLAYALDQAFGASHPDSMERGTIVLRNHLLVTPTDHIAILHRDISNRERKKGEIRIYFTDSPVGADEYFFSEKDIGGTPFIAPTLLSELERNPAILRDGLNRLLTEKIRKGFEPSR